MMAKQHPRLVAREREALDPVDALADDRPLHDQRALMERPFPSLGRNPGWSYQDFPDRWLVLAIDPAKFAAIPTGGSIASHASTPADCARSGVRSFDCTLEIAASSRASYCPATAVAVQRDGRKSVVIRPRHSARPAAACGFLRPLLELRAQPLSGFEAY
jgi:hypothetical protein